MENHVRECVITFPLGWFFDLPQRIQQKKQLRMNQGRVQVLLWKECVGRWVICVLTNILSTSVPRICESEIDLQIMSPDQHSHRVPYVWSCMPMCRPDITSEHPGLWANEKSIGSFNVRSDSYTNHPNLNVLYAALPSLWMGANEHNTMNASNCGSFKQLFIILTLTKQSFFSQFLTAL